MEIYQLTLAQPGPYDNQVVDDGALKDLKAEYEAKIKAIEEEKLETQ